VKVFRAEAAHDDVYGEIVSLLRNGGIVAFPTDTAYGLGADPFNETAVDRIFRIKGRPETKPILLLVDSVAMAEHVIQPTDIFYRVAEEFWPAPLSIVADAAATLPMNVTAGTRTVGVRWPVAPFATRLAKRFARPITATSANLSGHPSAVTASEVINQLDFSLDAVVDGGTLPGGGSTILDLTVDPPVLLRDGPVTFDTLAEFFGGRIRRDGA
jgi:L-threonylcarbamoyladenylate synthase